MNKTLSFNNPLVIEKLNQIRNTKETTMSQYISDLILNDIQPKKKSLSREEIIEIIKDYLALYTPTPRVDHVDNFNQIEDDKADDLIKSMLNL